MARSRNIKPAFFANDELAQCDRGARLLFIGLWTLADRAGRLEDRPFKIKGMLFPFENCEAEEWLQELAEREFITRYEREGRKYIQINNFEKHQSPHVNEPASTIPAPEEYGTSTVHGRKSSISSISNQESGINEEGIRNQESVAEPPPAPRKRFVKPTVEDVAAYCEERKNKVDAVQWFDFYEANGWKVGKNPMIDWKASVRTWERNSIASKQKTFNRDDPRGNMATIQSYLEELDNGERL